MRILGYTAYGRTPHARIASTVADLIGGTPLVRINHVAGDGVDVVAKVESFNPASSVKDRIARSIIDAAEASGALAPRRHDC